MVFGSLEQIESSIFEMESACKNTAMIILLDLNLLRCSVLMLFHCSARTLLAARPDCYLYVVSCAKDILSSYQAGVNAYVPKPDDLIGYRTVAKSLVDFWFKHVSRLARYIRPARSRLNQAFSSAIDFSSAIVSMEITRQRSTLNRSNGKGYAPFVHLICFGFFPLFFGPLTAQTGYCQLPEGYVGIACQYPGDKNILSDERVVFAENFEIASIEDLKSRWTWYEILMPCHSLMWSRKIVQARPRC